MRLQGWLGLMGGLVVGFLPVLASAQKIELRSAKIYLQESPPNYEKAVKVLQRGAERNPDNAEVHYLLASIYQKQRRYEEMLAELKILEDLKPKKKEQKKIDELRRIAWVALFNSGATNFNQEKFTEAATAFQYAAQAVEGLSPAQRKKQKIDLGRTYGNWAAGLMNAQKAAEAVEPYKKATALNPEKLDYWSGLGDAYRAAEDYQGAATAYTKCLELQPGEEGFAVELGKAYEKLGQLDKALEVYEKVIQANPNNVDLLVNATIYYYKAAQQAEEKGDEERVKVLNTRIGEMLEKARELAPDDPEILYSLGYTYYQVEKCQEALDPLEKLLSLEPDHIGAMEVLMLCYSRCGKEAQERGDEEQAKAFNEKALELYKKFEQLKEASEEQKP